jgi:hypothetical protein
MDLYGLSAVRRTVPLTLMRSSGLSSMPAYFELYRERSGGKVAGSTYSRSPARFWIQRLGAVLDNDAMGFELALGSGEAETKIGIILSNSKKILRRGRVELTHVGRLPRGRERIELRKTVS